MKHSSVECLSCLIGLLLHKFLSLEKNNPRIILATLWLLIVTILLCVPGSDLPKITWQDTIWLDKWIHIFLFMVLVVLWCRYAGKKNTQADNRKTFLQIMILGILYGVTMELVQKYFIPFRSFDIGDIIADGLGCLVGYFFSVKKFIQAKKPA